MKAAGRGQRLAGILGLAAVVTLRASALMAQTQGFDHTNARYSALLQKHVNASGMVNYRALKTAPQELTAYLDSLAGVTKTQFASWTEPQQLAFAFNLYNAATLKLIVDHYPVKSIRDIGNIFRGPWKQKVVRFRGETITLDDLEHGFLRKEYKEPRLHVALVCAAMGCPPLRNEAYVAEGLAAQLEDQSRTFLRSPKGLVIDRGAKVARISSIFKWYGDDFASVPDFVARHSGQDLTDLKMDYLDYDWSLNEQ